MRRRWDPLVIACTALCILCAVIVVLTVAPTVLDTRSTTQQIQEERARNIRRACEEQNDRNRSSVTALDELLAQRPGNTSPGRLRQSRASTKILIDALVPVRDCAALVEQQVDTQ